MKGVQLRHRQLLRQGLSGELFIIAHAEEIRRGLVQGLPEDGLGLAQVADQGRGVAALLHGPRLPLHGGAQAPQLLRAAADHIFMDGFRSPVGDALHPVGNVLGGLLLQLEGQQLDVLLRLHGGLAGVVEIPLQLHVAEFEGVEILAHFGEGRLFLGQGLAGALVQMLEEAVEGIPALPLAGLALEDHGLRQLPADLDDGIQAGHGVLEDHGDLVAPDLVKILLGDF